MAKKRKKLPMPKTGYVERSRMHGYRRKMLVGIVSVLLLAIPLTSLTDFLTPVVVKPPVVEEPVQIVLIEAGMIWILEN